MVKTALEKLRQPQAPQIVDHLPEGALNWGPPGATMVISTPQEIEAVVRQIPKGKLATMQSLREVIARKHDVTITCPITTGIFLNIVARASVEQEQMGAKRTAPWWRVLRSDGTLNERFPGGVIGHGSRLEQDGYDIVPKGRAKQMVKDFEKRLAKLS
jgi:alkylated DNA nucleotide flippase Atl1